MTEIRVDWFKKSSGKWYAGCVIDIGKTKSFDSEFLQKIVNQQTELRDGWQGNYDVVTRDLDSNMAQDSYTEFYYGLIHADRFVNIVKRNIEQKDVENID